MQIAKRIRQLRLEGSLPLDVVALQAGLAPGLLVLLEEGKQIPSRECLENLAAVFKVPVRHLFFDGHKPPITPRLTPRLSLEDLDQLQPLHGKAGLRGLRAALKRI